MVAHDWGYSHSIWGVSYFVCSLCKKKLSEWDWEKDDSSCTIEITKDTGYSNGFDFSGKTDAEVRRILGGGNVPNDIKR